MKSTIMLMADSTCDIPKELAVELGILVMPVAVNIGGETYRDSLDFTPDEFYDMLENREDLPVTAAVNTATFRENYEKAFLEGYPSVICVTINSGGASTFQSANLARDIFFEERPDAVGKIDIYTVDSKSYSLGFGLPLIQAAKMRNSGASVKELLAHLEDWYQCLQLYLGIYDLRFAKKSGRVSAATAFIGELMGFKPIMRMVYGKTENMDKVRGERNLIPRLVEHVKNAAQDVEKKEFCIIVGSVVEEAKELEKELEIALGVKSQGVFRLGSAVAINSGPRTVAVIFRGPKPAEA